MTEPRTCTECGGAIGDAVHFCDQGETIVLESASCFAYEDDPEQTTWRACDFCGETGVDDIMERRAPREFYLLPDGLSCCENCVSKVTA